MTALTCSGLVTGHLADRPCVRDVSLTVEAGEVVCLLGPNGAGKTTLLLALAGLLPRFAGEVVVAGAAVRAEDPRAAVRSGMVLVPDDRALFRQLSTEKNLRLAVPGRVRRDSLAGVLDLFPALRDRLGLAAGQLSGGEQQMLAIARALLQRPTVLLIDELSMGLAPVVVHTILDAVRAVADTTGTAVVVVEQHVHLALGMADRAVVMVHGGIALEDDAARLRADPSPIEEAYLGTRSVHAR